MEKLPTQGVLPGFGQLPKKSAPKRQKVRASVPVRNAAIWITPNYRVLLVIFCKSQKPLGKGHSIRSESVVSWGYEGVFERWVNGNEISVPGGAHVPRQLLAWESLGYIERKHIGDYVCWRLLKPVPKRQELFPDVDVSI